jgi:glutathione S-transferase
MIREADEYFAPLMQQLARAVLFTAPKEWSEDRITGLCDDMRKEISRWEAAMTSDFLAGPLSAVDFTYRRLRSCSAWQTQNPADAPICRRA